MSLRYSRSTGGFYETELHAQIPDDALYVPPARHAELMAAQAAGAEIVPGDSGLPVTRMSGPSTLDERRAAAAVAVKAEAARRINEAVPIWQQLNDLRAAIASGQAMTPDSQARFARVDAIRDASGAIEAELATADTAALTAFRADSTDRWILPD